jgi:hypothetical protein
MIMRVSAWRFTASTTSGLPWPRLATPYPPTQSMYSFPSASQTRAPWPRTIRRSCLV